MNSPQTSSGRGQYSATVADNIPLCRDHYRLVLSLPHFPPTRPGQFIQIACHDFVAQYSSAATPPPIVDWRPASQDIESHDPELLSPIATLRRPFSLAGRRDLGDRVELDIIHRVIGTATQWLATLLPGQQVSILGPLGNAFTLPTPSQFPLLVGGGVGIPPMIYLAAALPPHRAVAFAGALCKDLIPLTLGAADYSVAEFAGRHIPTVISTDDGSHGFRGFVTQALEQYLDNHLPGLPLPADFSPLIYTCGPEPMMKRVADIALHRNIPCQIAVERAMACGMGTCQSCCIRVKKPNPAVPPLPGKDWCYRLACTDGPIFTAEQLLW